VASSPGPFLGLANLLGGRQLFRITLHDTGEHRFGGGLLVGLVSGRRGLDAVAEAYHNPAAVWWGAFSASVVMASWIK
jgi:hypothetical protein